MGTFHNGFENIKVELIDWPGNDLAREIYNFGRLSHDYNKTLQKDYNEDAEDCINLINKIVEGTTLPKFAMSGVRFQFEISNISRICLAQITRDSAIFASASTGVYPLTQDFNMPMSIYKNDKIMDKVIEAQRLLEDAYIMAAELEIPSIEARYIGLHCQTISLCASYTASDFVRSCYSRTSSNFCDECNYVYRLMYRELMEKISQVTDKNSKLLYKWLFPQRRCINDDFYTRERLYNSDFTASQYIPNKNALNDWRKSGWKMELERMYHEGNGFLTEKETRIITDWINAEAIGYKLFSTYDENSPEVLKNAIKKMEYYHD